MVLELSVTFGQKILVRTSGAADRRNTESPTGQTPDIDCNNAWKDGRVDDFYPVP